MIVTDDDVFANLCRSLRNQGREGMSWLAHQRLGYNYRLSEINAAIGCVQCDRIEEFLTARRKVAHAYISRLMKNRFLILPTLEDDTHMSWFVFVVRLNDLFEVGNRDDIMRELRAQGIGCNNYVPPIHLQPSMAEQFGFQEGDVPVCEYVSARTLSLPFFSKISTRQVQRVVDTLEKILDRAMVSKKSRF
jgi:perosamine synthetase